MADNDEKQKSVPPQPDKAAKPEQAQKADKAPKSDKGGKPAAGEKAPKAKKPEERAIARLKTHFDDVIRKKMIEQFGYKNALQVPRLEKIVLNMGIGEAVNDRKK